MMSEAHDIKDGDGSSDTNRPVPVSEFGTFVSKYHAHGNKEFIKKFEVRPCSYHTFKLFSI